MPSKTVRVLTPTLKKTMMDSNWDESFWYNDSESMAILIHNKTGGIEGYHVKIEPNSVSDELKTSKTSRPNPTFIRFCLMFLRSGRES